MIVIIDFSVGCFGGVCPRTAGAAQLWWWEHLLGWARAFAKCPRLGANPLSSLPFADLLELDLIAAFDGPSAVVAVDDKAVLMGYGRMEMSVAMAWVVGCMVMGVICGFGVGYCR